MNAIRSLLGYGLLIAGLLQQPGCGGGQEPAEAIGAAKKNPAFDVVEASFEDMQDAMRDGRASARSLVEAYLARIKRHDGTLRATLAINPRALQTADRLDRERAAGQFRGPLHGIPIALKDNILTTDMPTTGGALAFADYTPPYEADLVRRLRKAGAIIIAKTTLTELANWVATGMPNGYNAILGHGRNPYDPRPDPRSCCNDGRGVLDSGGSSSGTGTAANFWAANVGTETSGSLQIPANNTMLVAIKPTVGRVSRHGIIPITGDQDTAGPMAKYVADATALLSAMEGTDPKDAATGICPPLSTFPPGSLLRPDGLSAARIGIPRPFFYEPVTPPGAKAPVGGLVPAEAASMRRAIAVLEAQGAIIVDPAPLPSTVSQDPEANQLLFGNCYDVGQGKGGDASCSVVMKYGMKRDFNRWLAKLGPTAPVTSLTGLRRFNLAREAEGAIRYGQAQLDISDEMDVAADRARWQADRRKDLRLSREEGIDAALELHELDALLMPAWRGENIVNKAGYPAVSVPFGTVPNILDPPLPAGFEAEPMPFGVTFVGTGCSEPGLLTLAYAFEQATRARRAPRLP
ncbi:MAG TPA: amidase family protein [Pseudohaliea sp.]|nr:amidase family protein [Pseudohaliea sp.]